MADRGSKRKVKLTPKATTSDLPTVPDFPDEWISVAAYYIWEKDGRPEGKDIKHWEQAKAYFAKLWKEENIQRVE
jgi:hypothetical protein